ncbi:hypothetical protein DFH09DRAFT_1358006 [Mycena vulgaris]|nr:hypothetical protein DFH09DRAFT_1358006 [Mycena vulgaris]
MKYSLFDTLFVAGSAFAASVSRGPFPLARVDTIIDVASYKAAKNRTITPADLPGVGRDARNVYLCNAANWEQYCVYITNASDGECVNLASDLNDLVSSFGPVCASFCPPRPRLALQIPDMTSNNRSAPAISMYPLHAHHSSIKNTGSGLRDKTNIVLVCRSWCAIGPEFLYEESLYGLWQIRPLHTTRRTSIIWKHIRVTDFLPYCPNIRVFSEADAQFDNKKFWAALSDTTYYIDPTTRLFLYNALTSYIFLLNLLELSPNVDFLSIPASPESFPHLRCAIENKPLAGKNIKYLELRPALTGILFSAQSAVSMDFFPGLHEISHHVAHPIVMVGDSSVTCLRLYLSSLSRPSDSVDTLATATAQLTALARPRFSSLRRVVLHGNWSSIANMSAFRAVAENIVAGGRELIFADGERPAHRSRIQRSIHSLHDN